MNEKLDERRADLVFELSWRGHAIPVFLLCEHQSQPDPRMPYRMLRYAIDIWERCGTKRGGAKSLPVVIPLVVHHGPAGWGDAPRHLHELQDVPAAAAAAVQQWLPRADFIVVDLTALSDEELLAESALSALPKLVLWCLKHGRQTQDPDATLNTLADLMGQVRETPCNRDSLVAVWRYTVEVFDMPPERIQSTLAGRLAPHAEEALSTAAEQLRNEGRIEMLMDQLRDKFGALSSDVEQRIQLADKARLKRWNKRLLHAGTLDDVFADDALDG